MSNIETTACTVLKGVGGVMAQRLKKRGIRTCGDLLFYLPIQYEDRTQLTIKKQWQEAQFVIFEATVMKTHRNSSGKKPLIVTVETHLGNETLLYFFHSHSSQEKIFQKGQRLLGWGTLNQYQNTWCLFHPEYIFLTNEEPLPLSSHLTPVYKAIEGVSQNRLRQWVQDIFSLLDNGQKILQDFYHEQWNLPVGNVTLKGLLQYLHSPPSDVDISALLEGTHPYQERLALEEILAHSLAYNARYGISCHKTVVPIVNKGQRVKALLKNLSFQLTQSQQQVYSDIQKDLQQSRPMYRLLQGDVGSGKTLVALLSLLEVVDAGYQGVLLVPTALLAQQHYDTLCDLLVPLGVSVSLFTGNMKTTTRDIMLNAIVQGETHIVVATHAVLQPTVVFQHLALVVVDEQQRFGVAQQEQLFAKGKEGDGVHVLMMSATPIPRTLGQVAYRGMACSTINTLPPGRTPIETVVLSRERRTLLIARIKKICLEEGRQVYWVCPLVEESADNSIQSATEAMELLQKALPECAVGLVHGQMGDDEKEKVMVDFREGVLSILVATTVIEVGVNVPNASLMVIEHAERMGLSQCHQLRGRVGRGSVASYCVLLYDPPLSEKAVQRLHVLRDYTDGFIIAEKDLEFRGPGNVLGEQQSGLFRWRIASLEKHGYLLEKLQDIASWYSHALQDSIEPLVKRWVSEKEIL
ncbi:MAG: ATP-dependent DNA helicase RecG [Gammaproteobacteria bacterium]